MAPRGFAIGVASGRCPVIQDGLSSIGQEALIHRAELVSDGPRPRNDSARHGPTGSPTSTRKTFATHQPDDREHCETQLLLAPADPHRHHHGAVGQPLWTMPGAPRSSTGTLSKPIASGWNKWRTSSVTQANPAAANAPSDHRSREDSLPRSTTPPASRQGASPIAEHRHATGQRGISRRGRGLNHRRCSGRRNQRALNAPDAVMKSAQGDGAPPSRWAASAPAEPIASQSRISPCGGSCLQYHCGTLADP
jgi:hypothetical protein